MPIDLQFFLNRSVIRWRPLSQTMAIGHWISCACCVRIARHDRALMSESDCVQSSLAVFLEKRALPLQKCDVVLRKRIWRRQQLLFLLLPHTNISIAQTSFFPVTTRGRIVAFLSCLLTFWRFVFPCSSQGHFPGKTETEIWAKYLILLVGAPRFELGT